MKVDKRPVHIIPRVTHQVEQRLHAHLRKNDPAFRPDQCRAEHLNKMPVMQDWMSVHCTITPYSVVIRRCGIQLCCGDFWSPTENDIRDLVMQRQPTPRVDPRKKDLHYYRRDDALRLFGGQEKAYVDLSDLPSKNNEKKGER